MQGHFLHKQHTVALVPLPESNSFPDKTSSSKQAHPISSITERPGPPGIGRSCRKSPIVIKLPRRHVGCHRMQLAWRQGYTDQCGHQGASSPQARPRDSFPERSNSWAAMFLAAACIQSSAILPVLKGRPLCSLICPKLTWTLPGLICLEGLQFVACQRSSESQLGAGGRLPVPVLTCPSACCRAKHCPP